jgi:hypothetical protein
MADPGFNNHEFQPLFIAENVRIEDLSDEAKMLRLAEALKAENVLVRRLELNAENGQLSLRAALALHDVFRDSTTLEVLEPTGDNGHLSIIFEGMAASQSIRTLEVYY